MNKFTVIGVYEETGQIFADHVVSNNAMAAFSKVADSAESVITLVVAIPGHLSDGGALTFPGASVVSTDTVNEHPEVFQFDHQERKYIGEFNREEIKSLLYAMSRTISHIDLQYGRRVAELPAIKQEQQQAYSLWNKLADLLTDR